jgi:hypothetical protein
MENFTLNVSVAVADNVLQPYAVGAFNHCTKLEAQNYEHRKIV